MDRETFLMGMKNIDLCHPYAKKFRNTYLSYIEKEKISKQNDSYWNNVTEDNFDEQYEVKWNKKWFYIGNKIEQFYNEMGWDIQKLYANKTSLDKGTQRKTTENELPSLTQCTA